MSPWDKNKSPRYRKEKSCSCLKNLFITQSLFSSPETCNKPSRYKREKSCSCLLKLFITLAQFWLKIVKKMALYWLMIVPKRALFRLMMMDTLRSELMEHGVFEPFLAQCRKIRGEDEDFRICRGTCLELLAGKNVSRLS